MSFNIKDLKHCLRKIEGFAEEENKILIEDLGLPEWFDYRQHCIYMNPLMKDKFKGMEPHFVRFSDSVPITDMIVAEKWS